MRWKTAYRSFYYAQAPEPEDLDLDPSETALLCIDAQNLYLETPADSQGAARWFPFHRRMREIVIPTTRALQDAFRAKGMDVIHARIACLLEDGRDRSLSQKARNPRRLPSMSAPAPVWPAETKSIVSGDTAR